MIKALKFKKNRLIKAVSLILATAILSLSAFGCQQQSNEEIQGDENVSHNYKWLTENVAAKPVAERKADEAFIKALCDFSSELMKLSVHGTENIALSPAAITNSLLLMANGASSAAQTEIVGLFGGKITISQFNEYMATYRTKLSQETNCNIETSFWINNGASAFTPNSSFLQMNASYYAADGYLFYGEAVNSSELINRWLSDKFGASGFVTPADLPIPTYSVATVSGLRGGIKWKTPFSAVKEGSFFAPDGEKQVNYMYSNESTLINLGTATGFVKELDGGFKAVALLPKEDAKLSAILSLLDVMSISDILKYASTDQSVTVRIPEFSYTSVMDYTDLLKKCGLKRVVSNEHSSFEGLGTGASLYLSNAMNAVSVSFGTEGVISGSSVQVAGVEGEEFVIPEEVELDYNRPFIYIVYDADGIPVYFGNVVKP